MTAENKTICGVIIVNMIRKGQVEEIKYVLFEIKFLNMVMGA